MRTMEWKFLIVCYLFLGGLSAGLFFVSALATLFRKKDDPNPGRIAVHGALMAPWPVMFGCLLLVFDLGRWYRFYKLFLHFRWTSPMSIGSWLLAAFLLISLLYLYASLNETQRAALFARLPRRPRFLRSVNRDLSARRRMFAALGLPVSVGVGIYTGVLLGAVQSRPFWNTSLVAQLFLFSALSAGCAALLFRLLWQREPLDLGEVRLLYTLDICLLILEIFIVVPYIVHGQLSIRAVRDSLRLILGGPFTLAFWLLFFGFGVLLPLAIEIREMMPAALSGAARSHRRLLAGAASLLVLAGGLVLRYIFVYAGQLSSIR